MMTMALKLRFWRLVGQPPWLIAECYLTLVLTYAISEAIVLESVHNVLNNMLRGRWYCFIP